MCESNVSVAIQSLHQEMFEVFSFGLCRDIGALNWGFGTLALALDFGL